MVLKRNIAFIGSTLLIWAGFGVATSSAQVARFDTYGMDQLPDNVNISLFPYFADFSFFQSVGVRYMKSSGEGMDYLYGVNSSGVAGGQRYGQVRKDGLEFPLISQLTAKNYLLLSKYMRVDLTMALTYRGFPNGTEDDTFDVEIVDPGFYATMGSFTFGASKDGWLGAFNGNNMEAHGGNRQSGFSANLGFDFELTPFVRGRIYDKPSYRVDYVDQRGNTDFLSGQRYPVFQNMLGFDLDWQMAEDKTLGYSLERIDTVPQNNSYDISRSVVYHQMADYRQQVNPLTAAGIRSDTYWRDYLASRGKQFQEDVMVYMNSDVTDNSSISAGLGYSMGSLTQGGSYETNGSSDTVIGRFGLQTRLTDTLSHGISCSRQQRSGFMAGYEVVDALGYNIQWADPESWAVGVSTAYETVKTKLANASSYSDWTGQILASRPLMQDLTLTLASAYTMRMNGQTQAGEIGADNIFLSNDYDTWASTAGLIKTLTERLKLYAYVEHLERLSPNPQLAGTRDTVGMTLGYFNDF